MDYMNKSLLNSVGLSYGELSLLFVHNEYRSQSVRYLV